MVYNPNIELLIDTAPGADFTKGLRLSQVFG